MWMLVAADAEYYDTSSCSSQACVSSSTPFFPNRCKVVLCSCSTLVPQRSRPGVLVGLCCKSNDSPISSAYCVAAVLGTWQNNKLVSMKKHQS